MPTIAQIIDVIEDFAHPAWQESFDNTGWQTMLPGQAEETCSGALLCVDATPGIVAEAVEKGCNLIISHHPLIFRPVKSLTGKNRVDLTTIAALRSGVSIYSSHTALDSAPGGISHHFAKRLGLENVKTLDKHGIDPERGEIGLGIIGDMPEAMEPLAFVAKVKEICGSQVARCSGMPRDGRKIKRVAMCGGSGAEFTEPAIDAGADVMITGDVKHNQFLDHAHCIMTIDLGHYETEYCAKEIFYGLIHKKFPNFALYYSDTEQNPITYL